MSSESSAAAFLPPPPFLHLFLLDSEEDFNYEIVLSIVINFPVLGFESVHLSDDE